MEGPYNSLAPSTREKKTDRRKDAIMAETGKTNIVVMWTVGPEDVAEGDRVFEKHARWMTGHDREGGHGPSALQHLEGPGAVESSGPELVPNRRHDLRPL